MEWWSDGFETQYSNIPLLQHSILCSRLASEVLLSSLHAKSLINGAYQLRILSRKLWVIPRII
jgi:hypothetical protein